MLNRMIRVAAFQNPEFYKAQAMRLPTWDKPRVISCSEEFAQHVVVHYITGHFSQAPKYMASA
jgi:hypothetical protein